VNGFLYVHDSGNSAVRKIVISTGAVTTFLSSITISALTCDAAGNLYLYRSNSPAGIYVYNSAGVATTLYSGGIDMTDMTITPDGSVLYMISAANNTIYKLDIS
jgi:DNA-binding beta-propeller fold protein YncE